MQRTASGVTFQAMRILALLVVALAACGGSDPLDQDSVPCSDDWQPGITAEGIRFSVISDDQRRCAAVCEMTAAIGDDEGCLLRDGGPSGFLGGCPAELTVDLGDGRRVCCFPICQLGADPDGDGTACVGASIDVRLCDEQ